MERSGLVVIKAIVVGALCLIILAGAWHANAASDQPMQNGFRWAVLAVMAIVVFISERNDHKSEPAADSFVSTGIVLVAMLALGVIGLL
ncbi:MAG: hypothetical protein M3R08_08760 [Bacteroidota bacterium]|nr:hypothetical protein [Bacteroidota bacterium]